MTNRLPSCSSQMIQMMVSHTARSACLFTLFFLPITSVITGYDLTFQSLAEFETWRREEEETHTIEFVKGDTHGSRTNPPRFKEHVKLVCARHSRRGRKQYVKKYPERTRKLPSRKVSTCCREYCKRSCLSLTPLADRGDWLSSVDMLQDLCQH